MMKSRMCGFFYAVLVVFLVSSTSIGAEEKTWVDLQIADVQIQPVQPHSKDKIVAVASIQNSGSQLAANCYIQLSVFQNGRKIRVIKDIPVLSSLPHYGTGLSVPVPLGMMEAGNYELEIEVDSENGIDETNEKNNKLRKRFEVWSPPYGSEIF